MSGPAAARILGDRLHLQHGPIDVILDAEGPGREAAFADAVIRFATMLDEMALELPVLRRPVGADVSGIVGTVGLRMEAATRAVADVFLTPMAAVAGAVADEMIEAMTLRAEVTRAYANNGGDIALHLTPGTRYAAAMLRHDGLEIGRIEVAAEDGVRGIATSGRHGRSHSLGIADSVTVLARNSAAADAAATLIANDVDLPGHPAVTREMACALDPDADLGERLVTVACGRLSEGEVEIALGPGLARAERMRASGDIVAAALTLGPRTVLVGPHLELRSPSNA